MSDLTKGEQANVRAAVRFLKARCGSWKLVANVLHANPGSLRNAIAGRVAITASLAVRAARLAGVGVDDVLMGKFPPLGTCPHCGHRAGS